MEKLIIESSHLENSSRLDTVLAQNFQDKSRSYFVRLIDLGLVTVDGVRAKKAGQELKPGSVIEFKPSQQMPKEVTPKKVPFTIVEQNDDFMVIDKPAGVLSHSTNDQNNENSLVNGLAYEFLEQNGATIELFRAGLVHRLDKDTSGLMIVAKTIEAQNIFAELFASRAISKTYQAVVSGRTPAKGIVNTPIGRHPTESHKFDVLGVAHKEALTEFSAQKYFNHNATLLTVKIATGRTHQIRVHMSSIGHPIIGDSLYGQASSSIARQALHACSLEFTFKGKKYSYKAAMPGDMKRLVEFYSKWH